MAGKWIPKSPKSILIVKDTDYDSYDERERIINKANVVGLRRRRNSSGRRPEAHQVLKREDAQFKLDDHENSEPKKKPALISMPVVAALNIVTFVSLIYVFWAANMTAALGSDCKCSLFLHSFSFMSSLLQVQCTAQYQS